MTASAARRFARTISRLTGMCLAAAPVVPEVSAKNGIVPGQVASRSTGNAGAHHSRSNAAQSRSGTARW